MQPTPSISPWDSPSPKSLQLPQEPIEESKTSNNPKDDTSSTFSALSKTKSDNPSKKKKTPKIIKINTSRSRSELSLLKHLIEKIKINVVAMT